MIQTKIRRSCGFTRALIIILLTFTSSCKVLRPGEPLKTTEQTELQLPTSYTLSIESICDTLDTGKLRRINKKIETGGAEASLKFIGGNLTFTMLTDSLQSRTVFKEVPVIVQDTKTVYPWKLFAIAFGAGVALGLFLKVRLGGLGSLFK